MDKLNGQDRARLRFLANRQLEFASDSQNEVILKKWDALAQGKRDTPTVRLLFSNFENEVIQPRLQCVHPAARDLEIMLLRTMVGRELFDDDTPISPTFDICWDTYVSPFGTAPNLTFAANGGVGFHINPVVTDLEEDFEKLLGGSFGVDRKKTQAKIDLVEDLIGDILPVRMVQTSLPGNVNKLSNQGKMDSRVAQRRAQKGMTKAQPHRLRKKDVQTREIMLICD